VILPDGKTWLPKVPPREKPLSLGWNIFGAVMMALVISASGWRIWDAFYWSSPPGRLATTIAVQTGVLYYTPVIRGDYRYTLVTAVGDQIVLSCNAFRLGRLNYSPCLEPLAAAGLAAWRPDWRKTVTPGPIVEVRYIIAENRDERFQNVVYSVRRDGQEYLNPDARLAAAGIDPSGRSYSELRFKQARRAARVARSTE
jgi:hypothetical protein